MSGTAIKQREAKPRATQPESKTPFPVDVYESETGYLVVGDIPGTTNESITLHVERGELRVEAHRETPLRGGPSRYERRFRIPEDVDVEGANARFNAGVLTVDLPKRVEVVPRQISVSGG